MRRFFSQVFASVIGFFIAQVLLVLLFIGIGISIVAVVGNKFEDNKEQVTVEKNSVLKISLKGNIKEQTSGGFLENFDLLNMRSKREFSLYQIISAIRKATKDANIKGIYLDFGSYSAGFAQINEILTALKTFKESGKFIVSYANKLDMKSLVLMSVANEIYLNPNSTVDLRGISATTMFYKGLAEKLGVEFYAFKRGKYKGAVEPYTNDKLSYENREQIQVLINYVEQHAEEIIAENLGTKKNAIKNIFSEWKVQIPSEAKANKLITDLRYKADMENILKLKLGVIDKDLPMVSLNQYLPTSDAQHDQKIAVIYIDGTISSNNSDGNIDFKEILNSIEDIKEDDSIKGLIVRINSPGGSAAISDVIYDRLKDLQSHKPIYVSMSSVAASGGYYIACGGNKIFADKETITGSIGVFGLIPNFAGTTEKLGLKIESVKTYENSDFGTTFREWRPAEKKYLDKVINNIYQQFLHVVAGARSMTVENVDEIAQGRIWSGKDAVKIGLVDGNKNFVETIKTMAEELKLTGYSVEEFPKPKNDVEYFLEEFADAYIWQDSWFTRLKEANPEINEIVYHWEQYKNFQDIQLHSPFTIVLN